jgi:hypothetical protein
MIKRKATPPPMSPPLVRRHLLAAAVGLGAFGTACGGEALSSDGHGSEPETGTIQRDAHPSGSDTGDDASRDGEGSDASRDAERDGTSPPVPILPPRQPEGGGGTDAFDETGHDAHPPPPISPPAP